MVGVSLTLLQQIAGTYSFKRHVSDPGVVVTGVARLELQEDGSLLWQEDGAYQWQGLDYTCTQRWRLMDQNQVLTVLRVPYNQQESLLHTFDVNTRSGDVLRHTHVCGQDTYDTEWIIDVQGIIEINYSVFGPKKKYTIKSVYNKIKN